MVDIQNDDKLTILGERLIDPRNRNAADLLKGASIDADFSDVVDSAFADEENRRFPIFSPEQTAMSALYMQTQEVDGLIKEACDKALTDWGISDVTTDMVFEKDELDIPGDRFLLAARRKLPIVDEATLEKSASALVGILHSLELPEKIGGAVKLYKIATQEFGMSPEDLSEDVLRYAMKVPCDLNKLASSVSERYAETHNSKYQDMITKIASLKTEIDGSVSFDTSLNSGIGLELYRLDQESGITGEFDAIYDTFNSRYIEDEDMEKVAAPTIETLTIAGYEISEAQLEKLSASDIDEISPGLSSEIFEGDNISLEKFSNKIGFIPYAASHSLGKILSTI